MRFDRGEMRKLVLAQRARALRREPVDLRTRQHAQPRAPAGRQRQSQARGGRRWRPVRPRSAARRSPTSARPSSPPMRAHQMRGATAEQRPASAGRPPPPDRRARPRAGGRTAAARRRRSRPTWPTAIDRPSHVTSKSAPAERDRCSARSNSQFRTDQRDFERRGRRGIADQQVGEPVRERVHRPGDRHAGRLMPPAPEILHRRQQSRPHDVNRVRRVVMRRRHGTNRTRSPGLQQTRRRARRDRTSPHRCGQSTASPRASRSDTRRSARRRCRPIPPAHARAARDGAARQSTRRRGPCTQNPGTKPSM